LDYGYHVLEDVEDPMVALSVQAVRLFGVVVTPTPWLVDLLPFCE
jgi:hypothetical protein